MLKPSNRKPVQAPTALARSASGTACVAAASVPATAKAAPSPCSARAPTTTIPFGATTIISDARANSTQPAAEERRAPNRSATSPPHDDEHCRGKQIGIDSPFHSRRTHAEAARHCGQRRHDGSTVFADGQYRQAAGDQHQTCAMLPKLV